MLNRLFFKSLLIVAVSMSMIPNFVQADEAILRVECRKGSDRGCTAHGPACYQAPAGKYIKSGTLSKVGQVVNFWSKQPRCLAAETTSSIPYTFPGTDIIASLDTGFCATLHIESGSGFSNLGKVAFVNCKYTFELGDIPD